MADCGGVAKADWAAIVELRGTGPGARDERYLRSIVSRAYYAAHAAATQRLVEAGTTFGRGWSNPEHSELPRLVTSRLQERYSASRLRQVSAAIRRLRAARLDADYRPACAVDQGTALSACRDAKSVIEALALEAY